MPIVTPIGHARGPRIKANLPGCVKQLLLRADAEFFSWESIAATRACGCDFIIANKRGNPPLIGVPCIVAGSAKVLGSTAAVFIRGAACCTDQGVSPHSKHPRQAWMFE
jgi:hypothetical protein